MSDSKTPKTPQPSSSQANELRLTAPTKWGDLTQAQLRYVFTMLSTFGDRNTDTVKTYMLMRFCHIKPVGLRPEGYKCVVTEGKAKRVVYLQTWQVASFISQFDFIDRPEECCVRLDSIGALRPVDTLLHGVRFFDYSRAETCYQGFLLSRDLEALDSLIQILYEEPKDDEDTQNPHGSSPHPGGLEGGFTDAQRLCVFYWFTHVRSVLNREFRHLFRPSSGSGDCDRLEAVNAQIRILTDGDITKEQQVLDSDCWRALTELDAKAKEAADMKREMAKMKQR